VDGAVVRSTVRLVGCAIVVEVACITVGPVAVLVDAVAVGVVCCWVDQRVARSAVISVEAAVVVEVVQDVALAGAAKARQDNDYEQQTSIHHHLQTPRLAQRVLTQITCFGWAEWKESGNHDS
jgi:hypothetical protein